MGISGLLPLLKKASKNSHVRNFSGCTVAIDAYCWLHKGSFGCAEKLGKGEPTDAYINYCMKYIQVLLDNKIKPILVLDGRNLPSKAHTEKKRREKREENRKLARKYLQEGKKREAWECFTKCVDITPEMARAFIKRLRSMKIDYVVAPYEADAQLAYLSKSGIVDVIITEDSDLILFGCPKIFFKMNVNGDGVFFDQAKIPQCLGINKQQFEFNRFRWMCIMSGCDYLPNLPGVGLGRARKIIYSQVNKTADIEEIILSIPSVLEDKVQVDVTDEYIAGFIQAENTFLYQLIFNTKTRKVEPLTPYPDGVHPDDLGYAGKYEDPKLALGLALGNVDLHSLKTVDDFEPMKSGYSPVHCIWSKSFNKDISITETKSHTIGMQISVSKGSNKKRPLSVTNEREGEFDTNSNTPDDSELISMYNGNSVSIQNGTDETLKNETSTSKVEADLGDSPFTKRRRLRSTKTEEEHKFVDVAEKRKIPFKVVKSQYFRADSVEKFENADSGVATENQEEEECGSGTVETKSSQKSLSIYSSFNGADYSQALSDISASQSSSQKSSISSFEDSNVTTAAYNTRSRRGNTDKVDDKVALITLDDDGEDEAYGSSLGSSSSLTQASNVSTSSETTSPYFQTSSPAKLAPKRGTRRQGLTPPRRKGRNGVIDPKQLSVKDMLFKQASKSKS